MKYVDVVIDNGSDHTDQTYTYKSPFDDIRVGQIVRVPFGQGNRTKKGFVFHVSDTLTSQIQGIKELKEVIEIDDTISLTDESVYIARFMKKKYLCRYIDAFNCMIPSGEASKLKNGRKPPFEKIDIERDMPPVLTEEQESAVSKIVGRIDSGGYEVFLLHGVTGSGKTEVFMRAIQKALEKGQSAIMLVPEISLTPQTIERFMARFGKEQVAVLHSKLTKGQRYDQWMKAFSGSAKIMIGARSAVFAPLKNLGIVIIDEEHEASYKSDMTPKYDAIDIARARAVKSGFPVVLGSATPSVVSTHRALTGTYTKIEMNNRYNNVKMPVSHIVDMRTELRNGNKSILSAELYSRINENVSSGRQVILFLNKRGYSSFISCRNCGYIMKCDECDISLTYHKSSNRAECHFCGRSKAVPDVCPACGSKYIKHFGAGTEKVEEAVNLLFPQFKTDRLDLDTTRLKGSAERILKDFRKGNTDILVGTQLVAKGLDFANVGLVGIIAADISLNIPDFRSPERTFQLITQASGRAGRGDYQGDVVIQTYTPDNYAIVTASKNDYNSFYNNEILMRQTTFYPPFSEIIQIVISSEDEKESHDEAVIVRQMLDSELYKISNITILGPQPSFRSRVNNVFRFQLLIKCGIIERKACMAATDRVKKDRLKAKKSEVFMSVDINPYSFT